MNATPINVEVSEYEEIERPEVKPSEFPSAEDVRWANEATEFKTAAGPFSALQLTAMLPVFWALIVLAVAAWVIGVLGIWPGAL